MENKLKWQNTALEPVESFEKGEYEELLKYVEENELMLRSLFVNGDIPDFEFASKYGCSKMTFFENFTKEKNSMFYVLFKLGELNGYLHALGAVNYENSWNTIAMDRFKALKKAHSDDASILKHTIKRLRNTGSVTAKELSKCFNAKQEYIEKILYYLDIEGFVNCYNDNPSIKSYTLSDLGIRLAKQLK